MSKEADTFRAEMTKPRKHRAKRGVKILLSHRPACPCGCGEPAEMILSIETEGTSITSPEMVDELIRNLAEMKAEIWGV